jgi:hypothetical protein
MGAFPVLLYNAMPGNETFFAESQAVGSLAVFWDQLVSIFTRGLAVLMGMRDDAGVVPEGVPWLLRVLPVLIALAAFALAVKRLATSRRLLASERFGPALILTTVLAQAVLFAASNRGWLIDNPRYILPLWWAMAMAIGLAAGRLWQRRRPLVLIALAILAVNGMAISLARQQREIVNLRGLEQPDAALFQVLEREGITRVSCRFAGPHAYWLAWRLSHIAGGEILFGHQDRPGHAEIRQPEWQREVDTAPDLAYLVHHVDDYRLFGPCLDALGIEYEWTAIHPMRLFWNLEPDLVRSRTMADFQAFIDERTRP